MTFLDSILNKSKKSNFPFDHWEYNNPLTEEAIEEIIKADIPDLTKHNLTYDGTRAIDDGAAEFRKGISSGGKALKFRCFVTKENAPQFPNLVKFIKELQSKKTHEIISKMINKDLSNSYVRVEVICDREGFWLKPHCDIEEKLMLIIEHLEELIKEKGDHGILIARKHISWTCKDFSGATKLRNNLVRSNDHREVKELINLMIKTLKKEKRILS